ncbi:MAG: hypothetical protein RL017_554, partial [Pseudomonadota bacterium]
MVISRLLLSKARINKFNTAIRFYNLKYLNARLKEQQLRYKAV